MSFNILVVNPKDRITQVAIFDNFKLLYINNRRHTEEEINSFETVYDQVDFRCDVVFRELDNNGFDYSNVEVVISRGGLIKPVRSGVYEVNESLKHDLRNSPIGHDVINIGGLVADAVASRIESAAEGGSIYVSENVKRNLDNKTGILVEFIREFELKNVKDPLNLYSVNVDIEKIPEINSSSSPDGFKVKQNQKWLKIGSFIGITAILVVLAINFNVIRNWIGGSRRFCDTMTATERSSCR